MGVVHLSAHLRRMHDAVFGAAPRGAVLLGNARSPITCSALASCPAWECTTPDNVQRPRRRLRNTPPPRPCQQTRLQRRAAPHLPRAARTRPQPKGAASQPPEMPTTSRTRRPFRPRSSLPPAASASRGWATSPCSCSPPRASPYAWPCRWPVPPWELAVFCANRPIPFGMCSKGDGTDARASTAARHSPPCICPLPFGECTGPNKVQRPGSASFSAMQELNSHATAVCMPSLHAMCPIRLVPIACNAPARSIIRGRGRARGRKPSASKCVRVAMCRWRSQRMALRFAD